MGFDNFSKEELISLVETLLVRVQVLEKQVESLTAQVGELQEENRLLRIKKNSSNSSKPPSSDFAKVNHSLREKSSLKKGGQPGHKGHSLEFSSTPDEVMLHVPSFCTSCGFHLESVEARLAESRQVVEIPVVKPIYIEHRSFSKTCRCGLVCKGTFPQNVNAPIQYGPSIESLASYLSVRQYMPYARMQELFSSVFGINIGQGSLVNLVSRFAGKCSPVYQRIKTEIQEAEVVGADETGAKVNGEKGWFFTWQNPAVTYISFSFSRGFKTIKDLFEEGFTKSVMVSDCLAAQLKVESKAHQICLAHLMRELNFFIESDMGEWAIQLKQLLNLALELKKTITNYDVPLPERQKIEASLNQLLGQEFSQNKKLAAFQKRLLKHRKKILTFLYYQQVPPDNNASERAIRNVKVKQKISGHFIAHAKAHEFATTRSVIDTLIKKGINVIETMKIIAQSKIQPE